MYTLKEAAEVGTYVAPLFILSVNVILVLLKNFLNLIKIKTTGIIYLFLISGDHLRGSRQEPRDVPRLAHSRGDVQVSSQPQLFYTFCKI